ncbi:PadR family transcriptional regulator [Sphaerimonospora thailandensis]|uniref:Transcriptional regulator n=1 Tax=Sphaerimonospora thailandensis TaxID=795644 RepID=A0A8J3RD01_9ACTN|nr:PadR family transcriptional regulator [Sphaerimonospora thailandensis]GIH72758.1 transcriptional regulator [Sphaerimonospora thailandensis]
MSSTTSTTSTTSTLGFAILALLARADSTGYEIASRMRNPVAYFWTASHSQIHTDLQRLLSAQMVAYDRAPGPGPQDKKVYTITAKGRDALREWITTPPRPQPERDELVLKSYAAWLADPAALMEMFRTALHRHEERLAEYERAWASLEEGAPPLFGTPKFGNMAALRCGLGYERHRVEWCRWMLDQLSRSLNPSCEAAKPNDE